MVRRTCRELSRIEALRDPKSSSLDAETLARHRVTCAVCREALVGDEALASLGRAMVVPPLDTHRMRRIRGRVLSAATRDRERSATALRRPAARMIAVSVAVIAFALAVGVRATRSSHPVAAAPPEGDRVDPRAFAGLIEPLARATWAHDRDGQTERVQLADGALQLSVRHQLPGERFVVGMPDGEIEVRGTRFDVAVEGGRTRRVRVTEGLVALRLAGQPERLLAAGEQWNAADAPRESPSPAPSASGAPRSGANAGGAAGVGSRAGDAHDSPADAAYARAFVLYQRRDYERAARAFHAFSRDFPDAGEAADAEFLEAAALAYEGRSEAAAVVAERFLERWPTAFRAREAAVLVARAARDRGDCDKARTVLAPWTANVAPSPDVVAAMGRCVP